MKMLGCWSDCSSFNRFGGGRGGIKRRHSVILPELGSCRQGNGARCLLCSPADWGLGVGGWGGSKWAIGSLLITEAGSQGTHKK